MVKTEKNNVTVIMNFDVRKKLIIGSARDKIIIHQDGKYKYVFYSQYRTILM